MKKETLFIIILLFSVTSVLGASFDCQKAQTFAEKKLCSDQSLSQLDDYLNIIYAKLINKPDIKKTLLESQQKWLQSRLTCQDINCIKQLYNSRITELLNLESQGNPKKTPEPQKLISKLNGTWTSGQNQFAQSTLTITNANSNGFDFHLRANNGGNTGELANKALFVGKDAFFSDTAKLDQSYKIPCAIRFQFTANEIIVDANQACENYGGMGVSFDGTYTKNSKEKVTDLVGLGLLSNAKQQEDFKNLTGTDYQLFLDGCGNLINEEQQSAEPKAVYRDASVRGLGTEMGCIIMSNEKNIWAAVIDTKQNNIKYFSNDPEYKNKLPKVIKDWADSINKQRTNSLNIIFAH